MVIKRDARNLCFAITAGRFFCQEDNALIAFGFFATCVAREKKSGMIIRRWRYAYPAHTVYPLPTPAGEVSTGTQGETTVVKLNTPQQCKGGKHKHVRC